MTTEIEKYKQIIEDLKTKNDKLQQTINEYKKQNNLLQQEVDKLTDELELENNEEEEEVYQEAEDEDDAEWLPLKDYENEYKIFNMYPYPIKKISNDKIIRESINKTNGYVQISLNGNRKQKHIIIAKQFIRNDDPKNKIFVDHIDQNRANYNVSNLRWVSPKDNNKNRSSTKGIQYEFVDNIPDEAIVVNEYGEHTFENYYYYDDEFYFYNGIKYRKLYIKENKNGNKLVRLNDKNGKQASIIISKFKKLYDLN